MLGGEIGLALELHAFVLVAVPLGLLILLSALLSAGRSEALVAKVQRAERGALPATVLLVTFVGYYALRMIAGGGIITALRG